MSVGGGKGGKGAPIRLARTWDDERGDGKNGGKCAPVWPSGREKEVSGMEGGMKDGLTSENAGIEASKAVVEEFFAEVVVEGLL